MGKRLEYVNLDDRIGDEFTLEEFCVETNRTLVKDYKRTELQISKMYILIPTGEGRGRTKRYIYCGRALVVPQDGRHYKYEDQYLLILKEYLNRMYQITNNKAINEYDYSYVASAKQLLSTFGYHNGDYCLSRELFRLRIGGTEKEVALRKELSPMKNEILRVIKFFEGKKKSIVRYIGRKSDLVFMYRTFWIIDNKGEPISADRYYNIETSSIAWEDFFDIYIQTREQEILNSNNPNGWQWELIQSIKENRKNPMPAITRYEIEKEAFLRIFNDYCWSIPRLDGGDREIIKPNIDTALPYAYAFMLRTSPYELGEINLHEVKEAKEFINKNTILELRDYANRNNCNMEYIEVLIDKYIRMPGVTDDNT